MLRFPLMVFEDSSANAGPFSSEDFLNKLFPNFWSFLINLLALIVLFVVIFFLAYMPVKKFVKARQDYACFDMKKGDKTATTQLSSGVIGKHAVYYEFTSDSSSVIAEFDSFTFD